MNFNELNQLVTEYYPYLKIDLSEVVPYMIPGMYVGFVGAILFFLLVKIVTKKWNWEKSILFFFFCTYVAVVIQIAYLSREPGSRTDVAFGLWDTWGITLQDHAYVIENVMMFIPFGFLFPMFGKRARYSCMPLAVLASMAIEGMQYLSKRGYCQLDDVVTNTMGAGIGYLVFLLIYMAFKMTSYVYARRKNKDFIE